MWKGKIQNVYISLPCVIGSDGIVKILELDYSETEKLKIIASADKLKQSFNEVL